MRWMSVPRAERARLGLVRQNALARRIGLPMIRLLTYLFLVSLILQAVYSLALWLVESGILQPERLQKTPPTP